MDERPHAPESGGEISLGQLGDAAGYLLRRAQIAVFEDFARRFAELDLSPAQFSALVLIQENPGRRQSDIAAALGIQRPNFVALMDGLEKRNLAARVRSGLDRRANALTLTPAGAALLRRGLVVQAEQEAAIRARVGEAERRRLKQTLAMLSGL